jgi:hypothetical protein
MGMTALFRFGADIPDASKLQIFRRRLGTGQRHKSTGQIQDIRNTLERNNSFSGSSNILDRVSIFKGDFCLRHSACHFIGLFCMQGKCGERGWRLGCQLRPDIGELLIRAAGTIRGHLDQTF